MTLHGVNDATLDKQVIRNWWRTYPEANIGIATGKPLLVLDVASGHQAMGSLVKLANIFGRPPETLAVKTGSGGRHYYLETEQDLAGAVNFAGFEGIDVRARGDYVIAPPSMHISGQSYSFARGSVLLAKAPVWLEDLLITVESPSVSLHRSPKTAGQWVSWAIDWARVGNRNQLGFVLARRLRDIGLTRDEALAAMMEYVARTPAGDHPYTQWEAENSVRQTYK
jgi:uncharacterized protein YjiS (DUF1127 family)